MSYKVGNIPEETKAALLKAATEEFAEFGFEKSSLRRICSRANVTTGALYCSFQDKSDLFDSVITPTTERILAILAEHFTKEAVSSGERLLDKNGEKEDIQTTEAILDYYFANKTVCTILFSHRDHPTVQAFFDRVLHMMDSQTFRVTEKICPELDEKTSRIFKTRTIHWFSHLQMDMIFYIIDHNLNKVQAKEQIEIMVRFLRGGLFSLIQSDITP